MLLEFLDILFDLRKLDDTRYQNDIQDIEDTKKKNALKKYNAKKQIEQETNPERKEKMQFLYNLGVTDFSDI